MEKFTPYFYCHTNLSILTQSLKYAQPVLIPYVNSLLETGLLLEDYLPLWMHPEQLTYQVSDVKTQKDWLVFDFDVSVLPWLQFKINN